MSMPAWFFRVAGLAAVAFVIGCGGSSSSHGGVPQAEYAYVAVGFEIKQFKVNGNGTLTALNPAVATSFAPHAVVTTPNGQFAYSGNSTGDINQYQIGADGTLTALSPATVTTDVFPYALAVTPDSKYLYAGTINNGKIAQYSIGVDGKLTPLAPAQVTVPTGVYKLAITPDGSFLYVGSGSGIAPYSIGADGKLTPLVPASYSNNIGEVRVSPDGAFLYAGGSDHVEQYAIAGDGSLSPLSPVNVATTANGIEAIDVSPNGNFAYVGNFAGGFPNSPVDQYSIGGNGKLSALSPTHVTCGNAPAQMKVEPSGNFLFICNSNDGTLSVFKVNGNGTLAAASTPLVDTDGAYQIAFAVK